MLSPISDRSKQLRAALAARLQRVRGNMTDAEFAQLVSDVVTTAQRFEEIDARELATPLPSAVHAVTEPEARS